MKGPEGNRPEGRTRGTGRKIETVSPSARRYRSVIFIAILIFATAAFALLTFLANITPYFPIDLEITRAIQSIDSPFFLGFMRLVSWPGFLPQSILLTVLIAYALYLSGLYWESVMALLAAIVSGTINSLVKVIIQRPRPGEDLVDVFEILLSYSFPSGHVMFYTILFGFTFYLAYTLLEQSLARSLILGGLGPFVLLVGVSRIYLGQHWASDVLGAYLLGGLILVGLIVLYQWGKKRFFVRQPSAPHNSKEE